MILANGEVIYIYIIVYTHIYYNVYCRERLLESPLTVTSQKQGPLNVKKKRLCEGCHFFDTHFVISHGVSVILIF